MNLVINGEARYFNPPLTLTALVEQLGMKSDRVAIELNRDIVSRDLWSKTNLAGRRPARDCAFRWRRLKRGELL